MINHGWCALHGFDHDIPFEEAAEIGTRKVITDHSTMV